MTEKNDPLLFDHEVDGIRELDNTLPRWWLWLFYITIAFTPIYLFYYDVSGMGPSNLEEYQREVAAHEKLLAAAQTKSFAAYPVVAAQDGAKAGSDGNTPSTDPLVLHKGKEVYNTYCLACHAADGGGLVGPNMTDNYYIHGSTFADSIRIIEVGVPEKGMISWKALLKSEEIHAVASFIYTLRGTTPAVPKAPEGVPHADTPADSPPAEASNESA